MALTTQTHDSFPSNIAQGAGWGDGQYQAMLVNTALVGIDQSTDNVAAALGAGAVEVDASTGYVRQDVTSCVLVDDAPGHRTLFQADPVDFGSPSAALGSLGSYDALVIFFNSGDDTTSWIVATFDVSDSGPSIRDTDGSPIVINPSTSGWVALNAT